MSMGKIISHHNKTLEMKWRLGGNAAGACLVISMFGLVALSTITWFQTLVIDDVRLT